MAGLLFCKVALVLALAPISPESLTKEAESASIIIELEDVCDSGSAVDRRNIAVHSRCPKIIAATDGRIFAAERVEYRTAYDGHRRENGDLAPLRC